MKKNEEYFIIRDDGSIIRFYYNSEEYHDFIKSTHTIFKTRLEARKHKDKFKIKLSNYSS